MLHWTLGRGVWQRVGDSCVAHFDQLGVHLDVRLTRADFPS